MIRFPDAALPLQLLPAPAVIKNVDFAAIKAARLADLVTRLTAAKVPINTTNLESEPGTKLQETDAYFEMLDKVSINEAARAVMMLYARGADQDVIYALVGARRRVLVPADNTRSPPTAAVMEGDDEFLARAQVALDASAPGLTGGGYAHVALRASAEVQRVSLIRKGGGAVAVVLQGRPSSAGTTAIATNSDGSTTYAWTADTATAHTDGTVSDAAVRAVAAALFDDWSSDEATGSQLTDIPMVSSASALAYDVVAAVTVPRGPSAAAVGLQALAGLQAARLSGQLVARTVPTDALIAAGRVAAMVKFALLAPTADVRCRDDEVPWCRSIRVTVSIADG